MIMANIISTVHVRKELTLCQIMVHFYIDIN